MFLVLRAVASVLRTSAVLRAVSFFFNFFLSFDYLSLLWFVLTFLVCFCFATRLQYVIAE